MQEDLLERKMRLAKEEEEERLLGEEVRRFRSKKGQDENGSARKRMRLEEDSCGRNTKMVQQAGNWYEEEQAR
jgi:hypothetical protein